ncbi:MAG: YeeE/YedE thiosulfate transporter family protein [Kofleriaceae bacterium]
MNLAALLGGALFGAGVCISGMVRPSKVLGFLNVGGHWDPSLMFVMAAGLAVMVVTWRLVKSMRAPRFGGTFPPAPSPLVDLRLLGGATIFGVGWGLSGYCPGPALVSLVSGVTGVYIFCAMMIVGMFVVEMNDHANNPDG